MKYVGARQVWQNNKINRLCNVSEHLNILESLTGLKFGQLTEDVGVLSNDFFKNLVGVFLWEKKEIEISGHFPLDQVYYPNKH